MIRPATDLVSIENQNNQRPIITPVTEQSHRYHLRSFCLKGAINQNSYFQNLSTNANNQNIYFQETHYRREEMDEVSGLLGSQGGASLEPGSILTAFSLVRDFKDINFR